MSHIIGRGRYARETYPGRGSGPSAGAGCVIQKGFDAVVGPAPVIFPSAPDIPTALLVPSLDRAAATPGVKMEVEFTEWEPGDVLEVTWNANVSAEGITNIGALAFAVPIVEIGGTRFFIDSALRSPSQLGVAPALISFQASGQAAIALNDPPIVQLGISFFSPTVTDTLVFYGAPADLLTGFPVSTWLSAERLRGDCVVNLPPEVTLTEPPIPA